LGFQTTNSSTPIIPVLFQHQADASNLSDFLKAHHIVAPFVTYPVKTVQYIVRITVSAAHTSDQIDELLLVLEDWKELYKSVSAI
jgi:7-keto-8-aminopelargonate synthetase-like enzyme